MTSDLLVRLATIAQRDRAFTTSIIQSCREYAEVYKNLRYYHVRDCTGSGEWERTRLGIATDAWPRLLEALGLKQQPEDLVVLPGHISSRETTIIFAGQGHLEYEELAQRLTAAWHDAGFDDNDGQLLASIWLFIGGGGSLPCQPGFAFPAHRFYAPGVSSPEAFLVARTGQLFQATAAALEYLLAPRPPKGKSSGEKKKRGRPSEEDRDIKLWEEWCRGEYKTKKAFAAAKKQETGLGYHGILSALKQGQSAQEKLDAENPCQ